MKLRKALLKLNSKYPGCIFCLDLQQALTERDLLKAKQSLLTLRSACKGRRLIFISGIIDPDNPHGHDKNMDEENEWEIVRLDGYHAIVQEISHELQDVHQTLMYDFSTERYKGQWIYRHYYPPCTQC